MSATNYWDYLRLDRLLELQGGRTGEDEVSNDELHFIVVHQAYELWFKLVLRELRAARDRIGRPNVAEEEIPRVVRHLDRVSRILDLAVRQFDVMESLSPQRSLAFRVDPDPTGGSPRAIISAS